MKVDSKLPNNLDAERTLLGAILARAQNAQVAFQRIQPDDFFLPENQVLFSCLKEIQLAGSEIDLVSVVEALRCRDKLDAASGTAYVSSLIDGIPSIMNIPHYAKIIREKALLRRTIFEARAIMEAGFEPDAVSAELVHRANKRFRALEAAARAQCRAEANGTDGATVIREIERFFSRFVILPAGAKLVVTLWAICTYLYEDFDAFPYLALVSPTKRCGKTRLAELLAKISWTPGPRSAFQRLHCSG